MASGVKLLLDFIGKHEAPRGYTDYYRGVSFAPPRPLTEMTVDEVLDWQRRANPPGPGTAAAGKYQIIEQTLQGLKSSMGLTGAERFDADLQDRMAMKLLKGRGWQKFEAGSISAETFANNIAKEWASMPCVSGPKKGRSYYDGDGVNSALCSADEFLRVVTESGLKASVQSPLGTAPVTSPIPAPKPVEPNTTTEKATFVDALGILFRRVFR